MMKEHWFRAFTTVMLALLTACRSGGLGVIDEFNVAVPVVHTPTETLHTSNLDDYVIAYCWRSPERDAFGLGRTDTVIRRGSALSAATITYPITPPQSTVSLGCYGQDHYFRLSQYGLAWRPQHNQLTAITANTTVTGENYYFVDVQDDLIPKLPEHALWDHEKLFLHPNTLAWSPDGKWLATVGEGSQGNTLPNIWLYNVGTNEGVRVTDVQELPTYVNNAVWSTDGARLAIGYGGRRSGVGIVRLDDLAFTDVSNESDRLLQLWPYKLDETLDLNALQVAAGQLFQSYLYNQSRPVWLDQSQRVVFIAPASGNRVALFEVNVDGTNLHELLPGLPGLVGLPRLSPDGTTLAFVRYPGWKERDTVEIAVVELDTTSIVSLAVLPAPSNNDELFISGLDWTPDGKYLAFSSNSNHEGQSDIYVISADGQAWINLTVESDGDAVNPLWKP